MNQRHIEYTHQGDTITIRIPRGLNQGKPIESDDEIRYQHRRALGMLLYVIHQKNLLCQNN